MFEHCCSGMIIATDLSLRLYDEPVTCICAYDTAGWPETVQDKVRVFCGPISFQLYVEAVLVSSPSIHLWPRWTQFGLMAPAATYHQSPLPLLHLRIMLHTSSALPSLSQCEVPPPKSDVLSAAPSSISLPPQSPMLTSAPPAPFQPG